MSSEFDEVAKAVAKNLPRRRILKLFAGGVAAAVGSALVGSSASAQGSTEASIDSSVIGFNGTFSVREMFPNLWPRPQHKFRLMDESDLFNFNNTVW